MERVAARLDCRRRFISIPFGLAHTLGQVFEILPVAPLTVAQVDLLRDDNVQGLDMPGFRELGVEARRLADAIAELAPDR